MPSIPFRPRRLAALVLLLAAAASAAEPPALPPALEAWMHQAAASMGLDGARALEFQCARTVRDLALAADRSVRRTEGTRYRCRYILQPPRYRVEYLMLGRQDGKDTVIVKTVHAFDGTRYAELDLLSGLLCYSRKHGTLTVEANLNPLADVFYPVINHPNTLTKELPIPFWDHLGGLRTWSDLGVVVDEVTARSVVLSLPPVRVDGPEANFFPGWRYRYALAASGLPESIRQESISLFPASFAQALPRGYFTGADGSPPRRRLPQDGYVGTVELLAFSYEERAAKGTAKVLLPVRSTRTRQDTVVTADPAFARDLDAIPALKPAPGTWTIPLQEEETVLSEIAVGHDCDEEFAIDPSYATRIRDLDVEQKE